MKNAIAYYRVSTARQGESGLGLEAQVSSVKQFCTEHGYTLGREFTEIESGKRNDRPILAEAIKHANKEGVTLVIAKLDRLARSVAFIATLMETKVEFRAADVPEANRLLLHILAAVGEAEAKAISDRTKAALSAAKARGVKLGASNPACRNLTAEAGLAGAASVRKAAKARDATMLPEIMALRAKGASYSEIAEALNAAGHTTPSGGSLSVMSVFRILKRNAR